MVNHKLFLLFITCIAFTSIPIVNAQTYLFQRSQSQFCIAIPDTSSAIEEFAAEELQKNLQKCGGGKLPIVRENNINKNPHVIYLGNTRWARQNIPSDDNLQEDGFITFSNTQILCIYGKKGKSTLYGVYDFLEKYLGFRLYTPDALSYKEWSQFKLPEIHTINNPDFKYREVLYYYPNHSQLYADWHKLHTRSDMQKNWGMFVHTFQHLIPVDPYFSSHPEWFSEINGKRIKDGQLCLSNPELLKELCRNLSLKMKEKPNALYWSVSNNDNSNNCHCNNCRRLDSLYGAPSGTLLYFINQIAARFPDKIISTLAYQYTRKAPQRLIVPEDNVNIMFCSIECGREKPIISHPQEEAFRSDMNGWKRLTHNILVWDYVVQFRNMMNPFPNLYILQPNLKYFHDNGVEMMFEQGTGADNKTSWMEIRNYLLAKLLWDVNLDTDSLINDFCTGYYEQAAPFIMEYFTESHQSLARSEKRLDIYGYPIHGKDGYLSPTQISKYMQLFTQAYQAVNHEQRLEERIRYLELSLDYAILDLSMSNISKELSFFIETEKGRVVNPNMLKKADRFVRDCEYYGINNLEEMGYSPKEFRNNIDHLIQKGLQLNLAYHKPITSTYAWSEKYDVGGIDALSDGNFGILDYNVNWLGFEGKDMDVTIDLETETSIHEISIDFFFYPLSWIFAPQQVDFYISVNGKKWKKIESISYDNPQILAKAHIQTFKVQEINREARYVRVVAHSLQKNPEWHRGVGKPCWIFADEIIIQ